MKIRFSLVCLTLAALGAALLGTAGCHSPIVPMGPLSMDTDVFVVGVNESQGEVTVPPGTSIPLGVYRQMSNGDIVLVTRKTEVVYHIISPGRDPSDPAGVSDLAAVQAGILLVGEIEGDFLVWADDLSQNFMNAEPLVVHVREGAEPSPSPTVIAIGITGITVTSPVMVGAVYILPTIQGIDWTLIPPGGISVLWDRPGDGTIVIGSVTLVDGVPQLVFNQTGIEAIASTIMADEVGSADVYFDIGATRVRFTIWVTGTSTPPSNQPPSVSMSISPTSGDAPLNVTVDASTSSDPNGDSLTFVIDWGDGSTSTGPMASYTYTAAGSYTVTVTVTDGRGGIGITSASIVVQPTPLPVATDATVVVTVEEIEGSE